jgi:hypothetical protein
MDHEKPDQPKVDGRPFDSPVGPTAQSLEGVPIGRPQLDARQLRGDRTTPSWKAPSEAHGIGAAGLVAAVIAVAVAVVVVLWIAGAL